MNKKIHINATVIRYIQNAMHDNLDGGAFVSYDASEILILEPKSLKGEIKMVYHPLNKQISDLWKKKDTKLSFLIKEIILNNNYLIMSTGLEEIQLST